MPEYDVLVVGGSVIGLYATLAASEAPTRRCVSIMSTFSLLAAVKERERCGGSSGTLRALFHS